MIITYDWNENFNGFVVVVVVVVVAVFICVCRVFEF